MDIQDIVQKTYVQYVYDKDGKKTAVIIPIDAWTEISSIAEKLGKETAQWDPSKYKGMYKDLKIDVKKESNALRDEWTRI
jgi:hypothetical protein